MASKHHRIDLIDIIKLVKLDEWLFIDTRNSNNL